MNYLTRDGQLLTLKEIDQNLDKYGELFYSWIIYNQNFIIRELDLRGFAMSKNERRSEHMCFCGSGKDYRECHNEVADNTAMSYLFEAFRLIDQDIKNAAIHPICEKGCADCCTSDFRISALEYSISA